MSSRPSKFVIATARWGLMAGLAGLVMSALAFIDAIRTPDNAAGRRTLLLLAGILLSCAFVLAPLVRRAFVPTQRVSAAARVTRKTLLDEIRERGDDSLDTAGSPTEPSVEPQPQPPLAWKLLVLAYVVFAFVLACVLWALQRQ
jgi:hypothetical protein